MRIINLIFSSILILSLGCENPVEQKTQRDSNLKLAFKNNSLYNLNNVFIAGKQIGNLQAGSSTTYIPFDNFTFDTGMPDEDASAVVNGNILTNHHRGYWCGTEKITIDSGKYVIEVAVADTLLFLSCENAPRIDYP